MVMNDLILQKIAAQLETARKELDDASRRLEELIETVIGDINANLTALFFENVKRAIARRPGSAAALTDRELEQLRLEVVSVIDEEKDKFMRTLREFSGWRDVSTYFLNGNSELWKSVKSLENAINKVLKKYDLPNLDAKNWSWFSEDIENDMTREFPNLKKMFIDKLKHFKYLETRYIEESQARETLARLEHF